MNQRNKEFMDISRRFKRLIHGLKMDGEMISHSEFILLTHIEHCMRYEENFHERGVNVSTLSALLEASKPATSKMLKHLEELNLIDRTLDRQDRRVVFVRLTPNGLHMLEKNKKNMDKMIDNIFNQLGERDANELIRITNKLYSIMEEQYSNRKHTDAGI